MVIFIKIILKRFEQYNNNVYIVSYLLTDWTWRHLLLFFYRGNNWILILSIFKRCWRLPIRQCMWRWGKNIFTYFIINYSEFKIQRLRFRDGRIVGVFRIFIRQDKSIKFIMKIINVRGKFLNFPVFLGWLNLGNFVNMVVLTPKNLCISKS